MSRRPQAGFTLIELLMSIAILGFMMVIAWSTTSSTGTAKKNMERLQRRSHEIRIAMARIANDLTHAYISANEDQSLIERRTLFIGKSGGTVEELRFSSMAHQTLWADANESEQTLISYSAESDREKSGQTNLIRRESRRLSNEQWKNEPAEIDVLLSDIQKVSFEYWDWRDNDWRENWDSTQADGQKGRVPFRVRITIEVHNKDTDETLKYTTQTRVRLQEELRFFTN